MQLHATFEAGEGIVLSTKFTPQIAGMYSVSIAQILLAWAIAKGTTPIIDCTTSDS